MLADLILAILLGLNAAVILNEERFLNKIDQAEVGNRQAEKPLVHPRGATTSAGAASATGQREREESNERRAWGYTCDPRGGAGWASQSASSRLRAGGAETARKQHAPWGAGWGWGAPRHCGA